MSINKKTLLGKTPVDLGIKDAMHVAIVSLRAGESLKPAMRITLNDDREAVLARHNKTAFGIVDPFLTSPVARGESFWGVLDMNEVPTVRHDWEHPSHSFEPPESFQKRNKYLDEFANKIGVTYEALFAACRLMVDEEETTPYSGPMSEKEVEKEFRHYELWSEWSEETGHEFDNVGTECCPEYDYPQYPFEFVEQ